MPNLETQNPSLQDDDKNIRPETLASFIGQSDLTAKLSISINAAQKRKEQLDHVLLSGPPGLGKTTLASIIARQMGAGFHTTSAPSISKPRDLAKILTVLEKGDILFIDEIHRLSSNCEEILYPAMEDGFIELIVGEGITAQSVRLNLNPFTLVGATTRSGMLTSPLKARFGIDLKLDFYNNTDLEKIIARTAKLYDMPIAKQAITHLAQRSRMTPRVANKLVRRVRDYFTVENKKSIDADYVENCLSKLGIDKLGLNDLDRRLLQFMIERYNGNPVGIKTLAALVDEEERTLEEDHEPFMLRMGLIEKTPRGRTATQKAYTHLNYDFIPSKDNEKTLFN